MSAYPHQRLCPQPSYRKPLLPEHLPGALLVRRTPDPQPFKEPITPDTRIRADQICDPDKWMAYGLSCSLLGQYEVGDLGWHTTDACLRKPYWEKEEWPVESTVEVPEAAEFAYTPRADWGVFELDVMSLHGQPFQTARGRFTGYGCHVPTRANYWHYELRFQDAQGKWLHLRKTEGGTYANKDRDNLGEVLRQYLLEMAQPLSAAPSPPWPSATFVN